MADNSFPIPISKNDDSNSASNPIFVSEVGIPETVTPVHSFNAVALAFSATSNHDYTVVGTKFRLTEVNGASTGQAKFEIQTGPLASLTSKGVFFVSQQDRNFPFVFNPPLEVPVTGTGTVRVIRKNLQSGGNGDLYTTIQGEDIA